MALIAMLILASLTVAAAGPVWSAHVRRDKEQELLRVGLLYARALASYRDALPGSIQSYPTSLDDLVRDRRVQGVLRHLREIYPDPLLPRRPWGLVRDEFGRIVGVYSQDASPPVRQGPVALPDRILPAASRYSDWKFMVSSP